MKSSRIHVVPNVIASILAGLMALTLLTFPIVTMAKKKPLVLPGSGMEARLFRPAVDNKGHLTVDGTQILPHLNFAVGLTLDFGFNAWIAPELTDDDQYNRTVIDNYIYSILAFNIGIKDMIVIGAGIPIVIPSGSAFNGMSTLEEPVSKGWTTSGGLGDIEVHTKLRWIRADRHPVGIGTIIQYQLPTGKDEFLMGDPGAGALRVKMIADIEPRSWYKGALNIGIHLPLGAMGGIEAELNDEHFWLDAQDNPLGGSDRLIYKYGPMINFGVGNSFSVLPGIMDIIVEAYGSHLLTNMGNMDYFSMEANIGAKLYVERSSYLLAGYAHGIPLSGSRGNNSGYGYHSTEHRMFIGFAYEPSIGDRDGDGIKDDVDQCPDDPEDMDDYLDSDGCPEPDNDRDGILDINDDCPLVPEDRDGDQDEDGCPERGEGDRDGDGILDEADQCPDDPEDLDQFEDADGCPDNDNDMDKILDINDECPNEPEDIDGFEDEDGCPDPDNDQDRIVDINDACPNDPEVYNGYEDKDGCPDQGRVRIIGNAIVIMDKVYFEYDSATIKAISYDILDAVAATIRNNPQIHLVEISGHADERGDNDYNQQLTADRAASVVAYLVKKGVKAKKLMSVGYGEYCPMEKASNETAWEKNRRVEFKVLINDDLPTNAPRGCENAVKNGVTPKPIKLSK